MDHSTDIRSFKCDCILLTFTPKFCYTRYLSEYIHCLPYPAILSHNLMESVTAFVVEFYGGYLRVWVLETIETPCISVPNLKGEWPFDRAGREQRNKQRKTDTETWTRKSLNGRFGKETFAITHKGVLQKRMREWLKGVLFRDLPFYFWYQSNINLDENWEADLSNWAPMARRLCLLS